MNTAIRTWILVVFFVLLLNVLRDHLFSFERTVLLAFGLILAKVYATPTDK